jgi:TetR/AcrR family transcriptional regulator
MPHEQSNTKESIILAAARNRFAYYGFAKVTMDEIAADVGLAKPSLYYYYPTKESLFGAVIAKEQTQFLHDMDTVLKEEIRASQKLRKYVGMRFRLFRELVNLSDLGVQSWAEVRSISSDLFKSFESKELKLVCAILQSGKVSGEFVLPHPQQTGTVLLHVLHGLRLRMLPTSREPRIDEEEYGKLKKEMELFIELLLTGIEKQSSP